MKTGQECATADTSFLDRLSLAWGVLWAKDRPRETLPENEAVLDAESRAAAMGLDLEGAKKEADALRREAQAERAGRAEGIRHAVQKELCALFTEAAVVMGQLALQAHLVDQGKPIQAKDVMALALGLCRVFEKHGLERIGSPEEAVPFDQDRHQSMTGCTLETGAQVVIRVPGYRMGAKALRKALVERRTS